jgi:hypothetical protein
MISPAMKENRVIKDQFDIIVYKDYKDDTNIENDNEFATNFDPAAVRWF